MNETTGNTALAGRNNAIVMLHVWIHSNAETGEPDSIDVFDINGKVNMHWFTESLEVNNGPDLAMQFYEHFKRVDDSAWFKCAPMVEDASGVNEHYIDVIGLAT